jgi:hypothetical protein
VKLSEVIDRLKQYQTTHGGDTPVKLDIDGSDVDPDFTWHNNTLYLW